MAYSKRNKPAGEHPSKTIVRTVKDAQASGSWPRLVVLTGKEEFLVNWAKKNLTDAVLNPLTAVLDGTVIDGKNTDADEIIAACESYPMMSVRKLVTVTDADFLTASGKSMDADGQAKLAAYLSKLPETTMLVITVQGPDKRKALWKAAEKTGLVYDFTPLDDETLAGWMAKRLAGNGKKAAKADLIRFASRCGYGDDGREYNLYNLENDLTKAALLADKETLSYEDLCAAAPDDSDTDAFRLLDSAFSGNKGDAFLVLHNAVDSQIPSKVHGAVLSFLGLLCSQLEIMLEARERSDDGQSFDSIQAAMGTNAYRLRKAMDASSGRSAAALRRNLAEAYDIEKLMRTGEMDPYLAMEVFIASL